MRLDVYRTSWGLLEESTDLRDALGDVAAAGYDGICSPVVTLADPDGVVDAARELGLAFLPQVFTWGRTVDEHIDSFREGVRQAARFQPSFIVAQSGRDAFDDDQAAAFFAAALDIEREVGVAIAHETHRGRILFTPWRTTALLERFDDLKVSADLSHFVVVCERLRFGAEAVAAIAERALHFDARVGTEEMPQVSDPRAPEYALYLDAFEEWWSAIWDAQERRGLPVSSCMPEFGPPPYQPALPFGGGPVGDRHDVNDWMAARLRARFAARTGAG